MSNAVSNKQTGPKPTTLGQAMFPVAVLAFLIGYGLIYRPIVLGPDSAIPLEIIFILAASLTVAQLLFLGHRWLDIQASIVGKFQKALPAFFILFSIGLVIGSWIVSGTIPMLVYYGLKVIDPTYLYVLAFLAPVIFSTLTGTSFGSVGTMGVVIIGIAMSLDAHLGITAGAIIGGAFFGDKMSPLSDTTNLAALGADVDLYEHIRSMMYTTIPSAIFAIVAYTVLGFVYPPAVEAADFSKLEPFLGYLEFAFNFNVFLLLPPIIVLVGSLRRLPTVPVLLASVIVASLLALIFQAFELSDVVATLHKGFNTDMVVQVEQAGASTVAVVGSISGIQMATDFNVVPLELAEKVDVLLNRGGLYALNEAIVIAFMVFIFIGAMDHIQAMPRVVNFLLSKVRSSSGVVLSSLAATAFTNAMTSNQYATSFIVGDAFKSKYDEHGIPRKVLSRSIEDTGTMLESIVPWTVTTAFMVKTLGVVYADYWHWQLLSLANIVVAIVLAITGIGCFYQTKKQSPS